MQAGIHIAGTGHKVVENNVYANGVGAVPGNGIVMSLVNPACNPNFLLTEDYVLNRVRQNNANDNRGYGLAALLGTNSLAPDDPDYNAAYANSGTVFRFNEVLHNGPYDLKDDNQDCASGNSELDFLNFWRGNNLSGYSTYPTTGQNPCVAN